MNNVCAWLVEWSVLQVARVTVNALICLICKTVGAIAWPLNALD